MKKTFLAISSAGSNAEPSKRTREQPFWDEHAKFIDQLVDEDFVLMLESVTRWEIFIDRRK